MLDTSSSLPVNGRRRLVKPIEEYEGDRMSWMEFAIEARRRLTQFIVNETDGVDCMQLCQGDQHCQQMVRACKEDFVQRKRENPERPVVMIVQRLDLLTLALCQDLDLSLYLGGGREGPSEDCVWVYSWSRDKAYCANILCGQEIEGDARRVVCRACRQVYYCSHPSCERDGGKLHAPCCSGRPDLPSNSYFMDRFEYVDAEQLGDSIASLMEEEDEAMASG